MYILKNAGRNILRAKGRSVLIGLIVCIIAFSSCIALIIMESAEKTAEDGLSNLNITATIDVDRQKLMSDATENGEDPRTAMSSAEALTLEEMQTYAASSQVQNFYYSLQSSLSGTDSLEPVETSDQTVEIPNQVGGPQGDQSGSEQTFSMGDFTVIGVSDASAMTSFTSAGYTMAEGQVFTFDTANNECVISQELALLNDISVGDYITLTNPGDTTETFSFEVTGLFAGSSESVATSQGRGFMASMDPSNQIYTNYQTLSSLIDSASTENPLLSSVQGTYVLGTPDAYEAFQADVSEMGLSDTYTVSSNDLTNYENSLLPLTNLKKFATVLLVLVLGIGGIILTLFSIFIIRERKYEVGVLTAIGMKKKNVATQFLTEAFLVAMIGVMVGTGLGAALSQPVADVLMADQVSSIQEQQTEQISQFGRDVGMGGGPGSSVGRIANVDNYIDSLSSSMDLSIVLSLAGICVMLTLLASSAALIFVMRYEPMRILSERE